MPNGDLQPLKWFSPRRLTPLGIGAAWSALVLGIGTAMKSSSLTIDPVALHFYSASVGAAAFLISRSHVLTLAAHLVGIRLLLAANLITHTSYARMRTSIETVFEENIRTRA